MEHFEDAIEAPPGFGDEEAVALDLSQSISAWLSDGGVQYAINNANNSGSGGESTASEAEERQARERQRQARERFTPVKAPPGFDDDDDEGQGAASAKTNNRNGNSNNTNRNNSKNAQEKSGNKGAQTAGAGRGRGANTKNHGDVKANAPNPIKTDGQSNINSNSNTNSNSNHSDANSRSSSANSNSARKDETQRGGGRAGRGRGQGNKPSHVSDALAEKSPSVGAEEGGEEGEHVDCVTCCERIELYAVGQCNHRALCAACVLRLRVLYKDLKCPVCKEEQQEVVVTASASEPFKALYARASALQDVVSLARFESAASLALLSRAWTPFCPHVHCAALPAFKTVAALRAHVYREHGESWCDLCVEHGKRYLRDLPRYGTREALKAHATDVHVHPRCGFCARHFFDDEALFLHCTSSHESCFVCERAGIRHQYFKDAAQLQRHYAQKHHVCPDPQCRALRYIAFASPQELQAHRVSAHRDSMTKDEILEARRIQIDVRVHANANATSSLALETAASMSSSSSSSNASSQNSNGNGNGNNTSANVMSFSDRKPSGESWEVGDGAVFKDHPLPSSDADRDARNKALRRNLTAALGEERARAFVALSGELRSGKMSAMQFVHETLSKYAQAEALFRELIALLPDEPRRRALLEAYTQKTLARRQQQQGQRAEFPTLAASAPSVAASSAPAPSSAGGFVPNASVGPSYRALVTRGGGQPASSWSGEAPSLSSANAFPALPSAPAPRARGGNSNNNAGSGGAWGVPESDGQQAYDGAQGHGRGKKGKQKKVLSAW